MITTQEFVEQLLAHMGLSEVEIKLEESENNTKVNLIVAEEESGLLIGRRAETIEALQRIIRLACQKTGDKPITVNINDFRERREDRLHEIARDVAERVVATKQPQALRLSAFERRIIHMALSENPEVETVSEGEGQERVLYVRLKTSEENKDETTHN